MLVRKPKLKSSNEEAPIVCSSDGQSKSNKEQFINICSKEQSNTKCRRQNGDKNSQDDKSDMQPVKWAMDMQSNRLAVPIQYKMSIQQIVPQEDDKNCQVNIWSVKSKVCSDKKCQETKLMCPMKPKMDMQSIPRAAKLQCTYKKKDQVKSMCSDKNCQEIPNVQMRPKKPIIHIRSVTKINDIWLPKPAVSYQYRRLCSDKNCQCTRCYKKKSPKRPMCGDEKNCQSANNICYDKEIWRNLFSSCN